MLIESHPSLAENRCYQQAIPVQSFAIKILLDTFQLGLASGNFFIRGFETTFAGEGEYGTSLNSLAQRAAIPLPIYPYIPRLLSTSAACRPSSITKWVVFCLNVYHRNRDSL